MRSDKNDRVRPRAEGKGSKVGIIRHEYIKRAMEQYNKAMENGYYIEAIALMESAISDRLESTLNYLFPEKNHSYSTIGSLIGDLDNKKKKGYFSVDFMKKIKNWADNRNEAVHEMVKLQPEDNISFQERYEGLKEIAEEGLVLFRKLDALRRKPKFN